MSVCCTATFARTAHGPEIVTEFIFTGVTGQSSRVCTLEILTMMSKLALSTHLPKTGCLDSPGENQSRKSLCTVFMKNWLPPELGEPVLAIESEPGSLENLAANSSLMFPPPERVSVFPVLRFLKVPSGGPPVPARLDLGSFEYGQPNWSMKSGMTRWKWRPL